MEERPFKGRVRVQQIGALALGIRCASPDNRRLSQAFPSVSRERARLDPQRTPFDHMIERGSQSPMVIVLDRHKTKRLQHAVVQFPHGA